MERDREELKKRSKEFALRVMKLADLHREAEELTAIFYSIIRSAKQNP
ncbi:MAG: hypothetical protein PHD76_12370 [Methylacidiphilales bacterium]|nr:hypothetical protein [Candidatus Methylacidiphilales bacterium]